MPVPLLERTVHRTKDGYVIKMYRQGRTEVSVHCSSKCLIDYGQELLDISRLDAAKVIKKMRKQEWVQYREYGYSHDY